MPSEGIYIIHDQKQWTCISTIGCQLGRVGVYKSLYSTLSPYAVQQVRNLLNTKEAMLMVRMWDVQTQSGASDCGLFSIACAECLCQSKDPCRLLWTQEPMRNNLTACLSNQRMSLFPGKSRKVSAEVKRSIHIPVFCSYRRPENKMGMVQCTQCEEWFHKKYPPRKKYRYMVWYVRQKVFLSSFSITDTYVSQLLRISTATLFA